MPKRLIVCCDGTWNKLEEGSPTNINRIYNSIPEQGHDGIFQKPWYQAGIGTNWYDRLPGGAFGLGIDTKIKEAYTFLCRNYESGDEIYLFGFSRGAYTVRSLGGLVHCSGLVKNASDRQIEQAYNIYRERNEDKRHQLADRFRQAHNAQRAPIVLLGCWDTVGALGIPDLIPNLPIDYWLNLPYRFHNTNLSDLILNALHVAALDEQRKVFGLTPMNVRPNAPTKLRQVWCVGNHESVGSTYGGVLADITLDWMIRSMADLGLGLTIELKGVDTNRIAPENVIGSIPDDQLKYFAEKINESFLSGLGVQPREIQGIASDETLNQLFHPVVKRLWCRQPGYPYRPPSIAKTAWQAVFDRAC